MCTKAAVALAFPLWNDRFAIYSYVIIDTDEIPGFFLWLKNHIFIARSEDTIFIFHVWDFGVAIFTNMISQLQESFPLKRAAGSFEISSVKIQ